MANSFSWTVEKVYTKNITTGGKTYSNVIARVEGTLRAVSGSDSSISTDHFVDLDMNTSGLADSFTAYSGVSQANVVSWIESRLNATTLEDIKGHMNNEIEFLENVAGATAQGTTDSEGNFTASFPWS